MRKFGNRLFLSLIMAGLIIGPLSQAAYSDVESLEGSVWHVYALVYTYDPAAYVGWFEFTATFSGGILTIGDAISAPYYDAEIPQGTYFISQLAIGGGAGVVRGLQPTTFSGLLFGSVASTWGYSLKVYGIPAD